MKELGGRKEERCLLEVSVSTSVHSSYKFISACVENEDLYFLDTNTAASCTKICFWLSWSVTFNIIVDLLYSYWKHANLIPQGETCIVYSSLGLPSFPDTPMHVWISSLNKYPTYTIQANEFLCYKHKLPDPIEDAGMCSQLLSTVPPEYSSHSQQNMISQQVDVLQSGTKLFGEYLPNCWWEKWYCQQLPLGS